MKGIKLNVIGMVYDVETGLLKSVTKTLKGIKDIPEAEELQHEWLIYWLFNKKIIQTYIHCSWSWFYFVTFMNTSYKVLWETLQSLIDFFKVN